MKMPYAKFILPTAPTQPVTMNMGMAMPSWYVTIDGFSQLVAVTIL
jgi:Phospholipase/Carboxylesterase